MKPIRSVHDLGTRVREQGRLRMGVKTGSAMKALKHWRFTSPEREPLVQLAELYGGTVEPWSDSKAGQGASQFQLLSTSEKIRVFIPPGGLSTWYEKWSGGGVERRCDGEVVHLDGDSENPQPCICRAKDVMVCKPKTRLSVVLPEIRPFGGVWRLDTGSWNAADEMAAMERMLDQLQVAGLVEAELLIEQRQKMVKGRKSKFVVPVILVASSAQQALTEGTALALPQGEPVLEITSGEAEVETAEIVDAQVVDLPDYDRKGMDERLTIAFDLILQRTEHDAHALEGALCLRVSSGNTTSFDALADSHHAKTVKFLEQVAQGKHRIVGIDSDGGLIIE